MSTLSIKEAAQEMGVSEMFLRMGLRHEKFPVGAAVQKKRWRYCINAERFRAYIEARDLGGDKADNRATINAALKVECAFREIAEDYLKLYDEGILCGDCSHILDRGTEACQGGPKKEDLYGCAIWKLVEKVTIAMGEVEKMKRQWGIKNEIY